MKNIEEAIEAVNNMWSNNSIELIRVVNRIAEKFKGFSITRSMHSVMIVTNEKNYLFEIEENGVEDYTLSFIG